MKNIFKLSLCAGLMFVSSSVFGNNHAKLELAKEVVLSGDVSSYATPSFRKLLNQANNIQFQIDENLGCEMFEHYFLGHGQDPQITDVETFVLRDGTTLATFLNYDYRTEVYLKMTCHGNNCAIDDVIPAGWDTSSLRQTAQSIIDTYSCQ